MNGDRERQQQYYHTQQQLYPCSIMYLQTADTSKIRAVQQLKLQKLKKNKPIKMSVCMTLVYTHQYRTRCSENITKNECV